jgi:hypothetical protein
MISRQLCKAILFTGADLKTNYPLPTKTAPGYEKDQILL